MYVGSKIRFGSLLIWALSLSACLAPGSVVSLDGATGVEEVDLGFAGASSAVNLDGTRALVSWTQVSGAAAYRVYQIDRSGQLSTVLWTSTDATPGSYQATGLTPGERASFLVKAISADGKEDTNTSIASTLPYAGITSAAVTSADSIALAFPDGGEADELDIYCKAGSGSYGLIAQISPSLTAYTVTGRSPGVTYTCKVIAVSSLLGADSNSATSSATVPELAFAGAESAVSLSNTSVLLSWQAGAGADISRYRVYRVDFDDSLTQLYVTPNNASTSYQKDGLEPGTMITFVVRAFDSHGINDGNTVKVSVIPYAGIASAAASSATTANVGFAAASGAASIKVYCRVGSGSYVLKTTVTPATLTSASISGLTTLTSYTCKAVAVTQSGEEDANTATVSFTTP